MSCWVLFALMRVCCILGCTNVVFLVHWGLELGHFFFLMATLTHLDTLRTLTPMSLANLDTAKGLYKWTLCWSLRKSNIPIGIGCIFLHVLFSDVMRCGFNYLEWIRLYTFWSPGQGYGYSQSIRNIKFHTSYYVFVCMHFGVLHLCLSCAYNTLSSFVCHQFLCMHISSPIHSCLCAQIHSCLSWPRLME